MTRKEFLGKLGIGAAFVLTTSCLGSCTRNDLSPVDFTVDLADAANSALTTNGGYIIKNDVVIARDMDGNYVAATIVCSHDDKKQIVLKNNEWYCTDHGARFTLDGDGLNDKGSKGLGIYKTELNGNSLRIFL